MSLDRLAAALADRYRIDREIGRGGMATVFLAEDLKHSRRVALKVLHPELGAVLGTERFLAEIRTTANLQHPNILPLFDSGAAEGLVFYVMPLVEGETLRQRIEREGPMPIADAVRIAQGVAAALDHAHRKGIIHRDIKPENILLQDGQALVADFGVALAVSNAAGTRITQTGISVGTPAYMSPEQAAAERQLDGRSDQYALGAVVYEMVSGEPPFTGPNATTVMSRLMTEAPRALEQRRPSVPRHVAGAVHRALEKVPGDRFASTAEFAKALEAPPAVSREQADAGHRPTAAGSARLVWPTLAVIAAAVAAWGWLRPAPGPPALATPPSRLTIAVPSLGGATTGGQRQIALTPDGGTLLLNAIGPDGENRTLRMSLLDSVPAVIPGIAPYMADYAISPDGREFLGSALGAGMRRYPLAGGAGTLVPREIANVAHYMWAPDGGIWFSGYADTDRGITRLGPDGSISRPFGDSLSRVALMQVLPGGRHALAVRTPQGVGAGALLLIDLQTAAVSTLVPDGVVEARYTTGYLVLGMGDGTLSAIGFDPRTRQMAGGTPVRIATGVAVPISGVVQFAVSDNGIVAYVPEQPRSLVLAGRDGAVRDATSERRNFHAPMFSPDGRRLSVDFFSPEGREVWLVQLSSGVLSRATFDGDGHDATWSPDGESLIYLSAPDGALRIRRARPGQTASAETLFESRQLGWSGEWLPDRSAIVTSADALASGSSLDIGIVRNGGKGPLEPLVASRFQETHPDVSPDGKWVAFQSDQSGRLEVYVRSIGGDGDLVQVSTNGGMEPAWSPDGRELYYRGGAGAGTTLVAASVVTAPAFSVSARRELFPVGDMASATPHRNYDISPDGKTLAFVRLNPATRVVILQNLPALVARLRDDPATP